MLGHILRQGTLKAEVRLVLKTVTQVKMCLRSNEVTVRKHRKHNKVGKLPFSAIKVIIDCLREKPYTVETI